LSQIYNFDETGLFWRNLPDNTQALKAEKTTPGRKISKEKINYFLKPINVSNQHEPGPSSSKD
jgi:hypothetical protein